MKELSKLIAQEDTVIFVGSGISRWSGLKDWAGVIDELGNFLASKGQDPSLVRSEAKAGDLLQAASYGFAKLTKSQIGEFIKAISGTGDVVPASIHEVIMRLGPTCFITTNYDDLLDQAFRKWKPGKNEPDLVTNRQLSEQANIVHAQARNFIFKPHGDARDSESIVLTREQYRMLLPEGPYSATLTTLKTLLPSRPMLFIGFGLRDPDFMYVRDLLANIYRGGIRDHYAIVADALDEQADYWREHYAVHLVSYKTTALTNGKRDHSALLDLLASIKAEDLASLSPPAKIDLNEASLVLGLARYAASNSVFKPADAFEVRVAAQEGRASFYDYRQTFFHETLTTEKLLIDGPDRAILVGGPGAGKSFAIKLAVSELSTRLQDACLQEKLTAETIVPIALDLKLYKGSLEGEIEAKFSSQLSVSNVTASLPVKLYLDGFNEMPRTYLEDGSFISQLQALLTKYPFIRLVIGSRTADGLESLELPVFVVESIPTKEIERRLSPVDLTDLHHRASILSVLERPFYFSLFRQTTISLRGVERPADLYAQYIKHVENLFCAKFGNTFSLIGSLEHQAFLALESGSEVFDLNGFTLLLRQQLIAANLKGQSDPTEILNWLISIDFIVPSFGGRGTFVHQSITEYLAARRLAKLLASNSNDIATQISLRRWDNAIYLALSLLDVNLTQLVLDKIIHTDILFAMRATKFIEGGSQAIVSKILQVLIDGDGPPFDFSFEYDFSKMPFLPSHEPLLRSLAAKEDYFEGPSLTALAQLLGSAFKDELIEAMFVDEGSWALSGAMSAISNVLTEEDIERILARSMELPESVLEDGHGRLHDFRIDAIGSAFEAFSIEQLREKVLAKFNGATPLQERIIAAVLRVIISRSASPEGVDILCDLLRRRLSPSAFELMMIVCYKADVQEYFLKRLDGTLLSTLVDYVNKKDEWAIELLRRLSEQNETISRQLLDIAASERGQLQKVLYFCATNKEGLVFEWLESLAEGEVPFEFGLLSKISMDELDWSGRPDLFVKLMDRHDPTLARCLLGGATPPTVKNLPTFQIAAPYDWLRWLAELETDSENTFLCDQVASIFARGTSHARSEILRLLDDDAEPMRRLIALEVLPHFDNLSVADLSPNSLAYLIETVHFSGQSTLFRTHPLVLIATEKFVVEILMPLLESSQGPFRENLHSIILEAGKRLGQRFVRDSI